MPNIGFWLLSNAFVVSIPSVTAAGSPGPLKNTIWVVFENSSDGVLAGTTMTRQQLAQDIQYVQWHDNGEVPQQLPRQLG